MQLFSDNNNIITFPKSTLKCSDIICFHCSRQIQCVEMLWNYDWLGNEKDWTLYYIL